jgi:phenylalanyl-tRNA synthetase beta chain
VLEKVRGGLLAAGIDEAQTVSVVPGPWCQAFSPWSDAEPLRCSTPMLKGADRLRKSLIPSLLEARRVNEAMGNEVVELFETAAIYLPQEQGLPREPWVLGVTSGRGFRFLKGVVEACLQLLHIRQPLEAWPSGLALLDEAQQCCLQVDGKVLGYLGEVAPQGAKRFGLRCPATVLELDLGLLVELAELIPQQQPLSDYPAIARDLNLIVAEVVSWAELEATIRQAAGPLLESAQFQEIYRDTQKDGAGQKRVLFSITLRSADRTLTNEEADAVRDEVVRACGQRHGAVLLG